MEKVELAELLARADFITLHTPLTDATRNILSARGDRRAASGACASSTAPAAAWSTRRRWPRRCSSGQVAGAALDVFETEPATDSPLFALENVVCTPHLGAATVEAQENVALQVAEQMSDFLLTGAVTNAINMPSVSAEDAPRLKPYMELCRLLGAVRRPAHRRPTRACCAASPSNTRGWPPQLNHRPLTAAVLAGLLAPLMAGVNMVNAPVLARERGIDVAETVHDRPSEYQTLVRRHAWPPTSMTRSRRRHAVRRRAAAPGRDQGHQGGGRFRPPHAVRHQPGQAGLHRPLRRHPGRRRASTSPPSISAAPTQGGDAICLVSVDEPVPEDVLALVRTLPLVVQATALDF